MDKSTKGDRNLPTELKLRHGEGSIWKYGASCILHTKEATKRKRDSNEALIDINVKSPGVTQRVLTSQVIALKMYVHVQSQPFFAT